MLSAIGLVLSLYFHIKALLGIPTENTNTLYLTLGLGLFFVWLPTVLSLKQRPEFKEGGFSNLKHPGKFWKAIFKGTPKLIAAISIFFFVYAMVNFLLFMAEALEGAPQIIDGKYVINNHGEITEISQQEYKNAKANEIRGFSGHWMAFYAVAMGILYPRKENESDSDPTTADLT